MSPASEQQILAEVRGLNGRFDEFRAIVLEPESGRLPVAERRLNAHARQLDRLKWLAGILTGGILVLAWLLQMAVDLLKLKMHP